MMTRFRTGEEMAGGRRLKSIAMTLWLGALKERIDNPEGKSALDELTEYIREKRQTEQGAPYRESVKLVFEVALDTYRKHHKTVRE